MPDPFHPNTLGILHGIRDLQQLVQVDGNPAYTLVKLGSLADTVDQAPWCTIEMSRGNTKHYAAGGRVDEKPVVKVTSGMSIMDPTGTSTVDTAAVEETLVTIRDAMTPLYMEHSTLQGVVSVYTLIIMPDSEAWGYIKVNGIWHRVFAVDIQISAQFQLQNGVID